MQQTTTTERIREIPEWIRERALALVINVHDLVLRDRTILPSAPVYLREKAAPPIAPMVNHKEKTHNAPMPNMAVGSVYAQPNWILGRDYPRKETIEHMRRRWRSLGSHWDSMTGERLFRAHCASEELTGAAVAAVWAIGYVSDGTMMSEVRKRRIELRTERTDNVKVYQTLEYEKRIPAPRIEYTDDGAEYVPIVVTPISLRRAVGVFRNGKERAGDGRIANDPKAYRPGPVVTRLTDGTMVQDRLYWRRCYSVARYDEEYGRNVDRPSGYLPAINGLDNRRERDVADMVADMLTRQNRVNIARVAERFAQKHCVAEREQLRNAGAVYVEAMRLAKLDNNLTAYHIIAAIESARDPSIILSRDPQNVHATCRALRPHLDRAYADWRAIAKMRATTVRRYVEPYIRAAMGWD